MTSAAGSSADNTAMRFALGGAVFIIAQQVAGKATRDALFLSNFDVTSLPKVVIAGAVLSLVGVLAMSRLLATYGPSRAVPAAFGVSAVLFLAEWLMLPVAPAPVSLVLYLHITAFGAVLISGFWSVVNERFDPHAAKRRIGRIAAAAALGGVLGGLVANRVAAWVDAGTMLLVVGALQLVCAAAVAGFGRASMSTAAADPGPALSGVSVIRTNPYLQRMGLLVVIMAVLAGLLDYALKAQASAHYTSTETLVKFFASFYAGVSVVSFVVQTTVGRQVLQRFGIGATLAVLPAMVLLTGIVGALAGKLWAVVAVRGAQAVCANSFHRSGFELLYTPLPPEAKRPTKTIIDVAFDRTGDMIAGGLILGLIALIPGLPVSVVLTVAVLIAGLGIYVVSLLHKGYVNELATSLRKGAVSLSAEDVDDATTVHILEDMGSTSEREHLMSRIRAQRDARRSRLAGETSSADPRVPELREEDELPPDGDPAPASDPAEPGDPGPLARFVTDLDSAVPGRVHRALESDQLDPRLTSFLIPLLGHPELAEDVRMELRWTAPARIGQLTDAMLDPGVPLLVRQRIPGVLEATYNARSVRGLVDGLEDTEFNVRYACARSLSRMQSRDEEIGFPEEAIFRIVSREVKVTQEVWQQRQSAMDAMLPADTGEARTDAVRINPSLSHVFTLLGLVLNRDALHLALQALHSSDRNLRGTALEYLENVLPTDIRVRLWRHLEVSRPRGARPRRRRDPLRELQAAVRGAAPRRSKP